MPSKPRQPFAPETIAALARDFADYRLGGCPMGGGAALQARVRKVAQRHGRSFSELWATVHAEGHRLMAEAPHA